MHTASAMAPRNGLDHKDTTRSLPTLMMHRDEDQVIARPFVGRLGGNQAFTVSRDDPDYDVKLKHTPDAAPLFTWREAFDFEAFRDVDLWQQAVLEGWGTSMLVWITGLVGVTVVPKIPLVLDFSTGPLVPTLLGALTNTISLALFIFAAGPVSGGHLNPLITISVFVGGLATFPRTLLYVLFQILGATIGAFLLRGAIGHVETVIPWCWIDSSLVSPAEALIFETTSCLTLVFLAFGTGLDPRQKLVYGPALGPVLIGLALGLCTFASGAVREGYTGASMNPARCYGLMAAGGCWKPHWVGAVLAALINGVFYWTIPQRRRRKM